ncbi:tenecin-1-like [Diabrotica undecimpunctata]|uniref:tenecin-1-like n=1 Tax=Diabrotica undecimpunctata TaxID=50387 RepID=UPI003B633F05
MKYFVIGFVLCILIVNNLSAPVDDEEETELEEIQEEDHHRSKRMTCEILGVFNYKGIQLNDAACAAHCWAKHSKGGWCDEDNKCQCR